MAKKGASPLFVHLGAGISAARKSWWFLIVTEQPLDAKTCAKLAALERPDAIDTFKPKVGKQTILCAHDADSLQWVVAAGYGKKGPRADQGEATDAQWKAFNVDVDALLARVHALAPILVVLRTVDDEYGTELSDWHAWSCRALPGVLARLAKALPKRDADWLGVACDLWREWLAALPGAEQKRVIASLSKDARAVFVKHGGAPKPTAPKPKWDPHPTLEEQRAAWSKIAGARDVIAAFAGAFAHLRLENDARWEILDFLRDLSESPSREIDTLTIDVLRAALRSPTAEWPNTHLRPDLLDALVRLGRLEEARAEVAVVALAAESYLDGNWCALVRYLDACGRKDDANVLYRIANRYVTGFDLPRKHLPRAGKSQKDDATRVLLELTAPARADLGALDAELRSHAAFFFEQLVEAKLASDALAVEAKRLRRKR